MSDSMEQLRQLAAKASAREERLRTQLAAITTEREELETAIRVLERISGQSAAATPSNQPNDNGALILRFVGVGEDEGQAPKEVVDRLSAHGYELNADLVRTQLWRMAKRGVLVSEHGKYWRPERYIDPFEDYGAQIAEREKEQEALVDSAQEFRGFNGGFDDEEDMPF